MINTDQFYLVLLLAFLLGEGFQEREKVVDFRWVNYLHPDVKRPFKHGRSRNSHQDRPAVQVLGPTKNLMIVSSNKSNSVSPNSSSSQYSSIITCEENQTMDVMNLSQKYQDSYNNVCSILDKSIITKMGSPFILEIKPEISESSLIGC